MDDAGWLGESSDQLGSEVEPGGAGDRGSGPFECSPQGTVELRVEQNAHLDTEINEPPGLRKEEGLSAATGERLRHGQYGVPVSASAAACHQVQYPVLVGHPSAQDVVSTGAHRDSRCGVPGRRSLAVQGEGPV